MKRPDEPRVQPPRRNFALDLVLVRSHKRPREDREAGAGAVRPASVARQAKAQRSSDAPTATVNISNGKTLCVRVALAFHWLRV